MDVGSFSLLFLLLIVVFQVYTYCNEGFQNPKFRMPESPVAQKNLVEPSEEEYAPMSVRSTGAAPGAIGSFNSLPYQDPTLEKANYQRILNIQTTLKGFLQNEAPNIQELSDPSIQLPLSSARADLDKLNNEVLVMKRNAGIESSLTQGDVDGIQANMSYLQRKWRMSIYNDLNSVEGFQNTDDPDAMSGSSNYDSPVGSSNYDSPVGSSNYNSPVGSSNYDSPVGSSNYNSPVGSGNYNSNTSNYVTLSNADILGRIINTIFSGSNTSNSSNITTSNNISLNDLRTLITKIDVTIARLTSSGTTDPVVLARVDVLNKIKARIKSIMNDVISGVRDEKDIPITKDAMDEFLKVIANTSSPLSKLFGSNVALADLFPAYSAGDTNGAMFSQYLFKQYADTLFKGLSWDVGMNIKYTSENERDMANSFASAIQSSVKNMNVNTQPFGATTLNDYSPSYGGNTFSNVINNLQQQQQQQQQQEKQQQQQEKQQQQQQQQKASKGQPFNWHERANLICDSVQKRGLNPSEFGCLRPEEYVSENFSWRGYAKMICGRLATSYDTGLPEICGCPPNSWAGWKS